MIGRCRLQDRCHVCAVKPLAHSIDHRKTDLRRRNIALPQNAAENLFCRDRVEGTM